MLTSPPIHANACLPGFGQMAFFVLESCCCQISKQQFCHRLRERQSKAASRELGVAEAKVVALTSLGRVLQFLSRVGRTGTSR